MIFEIEKNILDTFPTHDIKVYFYASGCEWTKINLTSEFDIWTLEYISLHGKNIYFENSDAQKLDGSKIFKKPDNATKWHQNNEKYLFVSPKVQSRCWCATSFSFEKKLIDKSKLRTLQWLFKK